MRGTTLKPLTETQVGELVELYAALEDRYDGAEDSSTRWMGEHLYNLRLILSHQGVTL